jgi:hypothetical protein
MLPRTSKEKSARVDWGYHARPTPLARTRRVLWLAAAVLVVAPLTGLTAAAVVGRSPPQFSLAASRGPLASPHAAWDAQCEACHTPFSPIGSDRWFDTLLGRPAVPTAARDLKCVHCHAAPAHHPNVPAGAESGCVECHSDHQGRDHNLLRTADAACVRCHGDLPAHHTNRSAVKVKSITGFAKPGGHPEFRNNPADTDRHQRTLKFDHAVHLTSDRMMEQYFASMSAADRQRYAGYEALLKSTDEVARTKLCAECHRLDAGRTDGPAPRLGELPREPLAPPRADGRYFLPVVYDAHCRACHPLKFDGVDAKLKETQAPHRVTPDQLTAFLQQAYTAAYIDRGLAGLPPPPRGIGRLDPPVEAAAEARGKIAERVDAARTRLEGDNGCQKCHFPEAGGRTFKPTTVPTVWMPRARFDHTAHRAMDCKGCHPANYAAQPPPAEPYQWTPDLPGLASCQTCHSPAGGVRHGCTDCHTYHHADHRLTGRGEPARAPLSLFPDATDWLRGRKE